MRRRRRKDKEWLSVFAIAFGLGLFLAMCGYYKLVLLIAAIVLIYMGAGSRKC